MKYCEKQNYLGGVNLATQGLGDISENRPATGIGKVGLGALGAIASPATGLITVSKAAGTTVDTTALE